MDAGDIALHISVAPSAMGYQDHDPSSKELQGSECRRPHLQMRNPSEEDAAMWEEALSA